ncbi:MAG: hypothetical protein J0H43_14935, partial [Actinobacteria bacterium]|nr:hypothetical protein [Actinomycetota bacterium]
RSLTSAAQHQPDSWHLVVPIDHNPDELRWFANLKAEYPFVDRWHGRTWLEEQLVKHQDLVRYATQNEFLDYVRQYKIETEALTRGVPDLVERQEALHALGDTISPHWRPVVTRLPDGTPMVTLQAKHPGAAEEAPIAIQLTAKIPPAPETRELRDQVVSSRDFGTSVVIPGEFISGLTFDGPAGLGLPGPDARPERVVLVATPDTADLPTQTLAVYAPRGAYPLATLRLQTQERTTGTVGPRFVAFDESRTVRLVTEVGPDKIGLQIQTENGHPCTPSAVLPGLRFMRALRPPNILAITVQRDGRSMTERSLIEGAVADALPDEIVEYIEDLAAIQEHTNDRFPVPGTVTPADIELASRLRRLFAGESVPWLNDQLELTLAPTGVTTFKAQVADGRGWLCIAAPDEEIAVGEHTVHTGPLHLFGLVTIDPASVPDQPGDEQEISVIFRLDEGAWFYAKLGLPDGVSLPLIPDSLDASTPQGEVDSLDSSVSEPDSRTTCPDLSRLEYRLVRSTLTATSPDGAADRSGGGVRVGLIIAAHAVCVAGALASYVCSG